MNSDYIKSLEEQNEELRQKLALSEFEAEEYKNIVKSRKGKLVLLSASASALRLEYLADIIISPTQKQPNGSYLFEVIKDRSGKFQKQTFTVEQIREQSQNFWQ